MPDFDAIYGYRRVSTGNIIVPGLDNQFYVYFAQTADIKDQIYMEEHEFVRAQWLTPQEAMELFFKK